MIDERDIKKLRKEFATKNEVHNIVQNAVKDLIEYISISQQSMKVEIVRDIRQAIREEIAPVLFNHESRIRNLETKQN